MWCVGGRRHDVDDTVETGVLSRQALPVGYLAGFKETEMEAIKLFQHALVLVVLLSAPPLIVATVLGVGMSLVQTLFQVQDQTAPFFLKLIGVSVTLLFAARWMQSEIILLSNQVFLTIASVGH